MKVTKENVEKAIEHVDGIVKEIADKVGMFSYDAKNLVDKWCYLRKDIAHSAANIINGAAAKG